MFYVLVRHTVVYKKEDITGFIAVWKHKSHANAEYNAQKKYMFPEHISENLCTYKPHPVPLIILHHIILITQIRVPDQE